MAAHTPKPGGIGGDVEIEVNKTMHEQTAAANRRAELNPPPPHGGDTDAPRALRGSQRPDTVKRPATVRWGWLPHRL